MQAGARPAPAAGAGCLRWLVRTTPAGSNSPVFGRGRPRQPLMCARAGRVPAPAPAHVAVSPHHYNHYYLLDHHYYIHYNPVITTLLPIITVIMSPLLLIITSVLPEYYS